MAIKMLIMDVDGTLTDGKIYVMDNMEGIKAFNIKDGYGIKNILPQYDIIPVIITGKKSKMLEKRAEELSITELYQGIDFKLYIYEMLKEKYSLNDKEIAFIGDDLNDLECMEHCGVKGCPSDAVTGIKSISNYVCEKAGGDGAVREFIEYIIGINYWFCKDKYEDSDES